MAYVAVGAAWLAGIAGCVYLVMNGHPGMGTVVLVLPLLTSASRDRS